MGLSRAIKKNILTKNFYDNFINIQKISLEIPDKEIQCIFLIVPDL